MLGGKLIATGSDSCVFFPSIPCKNDKDSDKNSVSKIGYSKFNDFKREYKVSKNLKKIKNYSNYFLIYDKHCKPLSYNELIKKDKDFINCVENEILEENFNKFSKMLIGIKGGVTLEYYFKKKFKPFMEKNSEYNIKKMKPTFIDFMKKMENLFIGLKKLNEIDLMHLDFKCNNVLIHDSKFKIIDFGLSCKIDNIKKIKKRSLDEYKTNRLYIPYPLEFLFLFLNNNELNNELNIFNYLGIEMYRADSSYYSGKVYYKIFKGIFNVNINDHFLKIIQMFLKNTVDIKLLLKKLKVYSLGILIPELFISEGFSLNLMKKNPFMNDFFKLFNEMCNPIYSERITLNNAHKKFKKLIKKYSKQKTYKKTKRSLRKRK
jgi:hypothetical protein